LATKHEEIRKKDSEKGMQLLYIGRLCLLKSVMIALPPFLYPFFQNTKQEWEMK